MTTDPTSTQTVNRIKLPTGSADRVAKTVGVTAAYVRMIAKGTRYDQSDKALAVKAALKVEYAMEEKRIRQIQKKLDKLSA